MVAIGNYYILCNSNSVCNFVFHFVTDINGETRKSYGNVDVLSFDLKRCTDM